MKKVLLIIGTAVVHIGLIICPDKSTHLKRKGALCANTASYPPAPEVRFRDLDGKDVSLSQYKGRVVFVNFWATWCAPCQAEIPWLIEMQQKYPSKGFTILGVDVDDEGNNEIGRASCRERVKLGGQALPVNYPRRN